MASVTVISPASAPAAALLAPSAPPPSASLALRPSHASPAPAPFFGKPIKLSLPRQGSHGLLALAVRPKASSDEDSTGFQAEELLDDLKSKWDSIENKTSVVIYGGGALLALWLSSSIISAVNSVPLLPKFLELVGLAYTGWFAYRYLLFKENRKELVADVEELASKITGSDKE